MKTTLAAAILAFSIFTAQAEDEKPGRFKLRPATVFLGGKTETIFKIDTQTGKTWILDVLSTPTAPKWIEVAEPSSDRRR